MNNFNIDNTNEIIDKIPNNNEILLLGESNHGCEEFYKIRSNITKKLIDNYDYNIILFESDWFNIFNETIYTKIILLVFVAFLGGSQEMLCMILRHALCAVVIPSQSEVY